MNKKQLELESRVEEEVIDLRHYWRVLMRFRISIIAWTLSAAFVTAIIVSLQNDIYSAEAVLLIEGNQTQITSIQQIYGVDSQEQEYYATQHELLKNRTLAEKVIQDLNLVENREFTPEGRPIFRQFLSHAAEETGRLLSFLTPWSDSSSGDQEMSAAFRDQVLLANVLSGFNRRLAIEPVRNTQLVKIRFEANDPQLAADVANQLAFVYIEDNLNQRLAATQTANNWLSERLDGLRSTLEDSELRLQEYLEQEQLLVNIGTVTSLNEQELDELTTQSIEARRRSADAEAVYRQVQQLRDRSTDELMSIPAILNHPSVQEVRENLDQINREISELSKRYGRNHPRMIALVSQQVTTDSDLSRQVRQVHASIENEYLSAQESERSSLARLDESKNQLQGINRNNFTLHELQREVETNKQLYDMFFTRIRETDETDSFQDTNAVVVDPAIAAIYPSKPRRPLIVMVATVIGLLFGLALALFKDMLDNTVKTPADVEERLHAELLGVVPLEKETRPRQDRKLAFLGFNKTNNTGFTESLRTIRTGIALSSIENPHKVIAVTSSVMNEGKTTVAANLAAAMGQVGKTLLIDADIRKPSVANSIWLNPNPPGLSNLVADGIGVKDNCIHPWHKGGVDVLPAGQHVSNPLELLASKKFSEILDHLQGQYETIIIDTPPVNFVSDALVIGTGKAVVYVVKSRSTSINSIQSGLSRLRNAQANIVGVVLNQVDTSKLSYYGEDEYYGGYYGADQNSDGSITNTA